MNEITDPARHSITEQVMALVARYSKRFYVDAERFDIARLPVPGVTTVRDTIGLDAVNAEGCLDWVCQMVVPYRSAGIHEFLYVPNISAADAKKYVLESWDTEQYPWPAELLDFQFISDPNFPHSGYAIQPPTVVDGTPGPAALGRVERPRIYTQRAYRDAVSCATQVRYRFYISNKPFPRNDFLTPQPQPTEISWNFGTSEGRMLCLHDDLTVPAQDMSYPLLVGTAYGTQGSGSVPGQFFPRTNFRRRAPFDVVSQNPQAEASGFFIKIKKTLYPPPAAKPTVLDNQ
jgi:hypothetical protein